MSLVRLLEGFITTLIGVNLVAPVAQQVGAAQADGNVTGASNTLLGLVTLFFVIGVMIAGVQIAIGGLADMGFV